MALVVLAFAGLVAPAFISMITTSDADAAAGDAAGDNPWEGHTLEWSTTSPAPADNFSVAPTVMSPEPLLDMKAAPDFAPSAAAQSTGAAG